MPKGKVSKIITPCIIDDFIVRIGGVFFGGLASGIGDGVGIL
jgi:hypothetical protein